MKFAIFAAAAALFGAVSAAPTMHKPNHVARDVHVIGLRHIAADSVPTYQSIQYAGKSKRGTRVTPKIINREPQDGLPAEAAVRTDENGNIVLYAKRQISAEVATKSDGKGGIIAYAKRQVAAEDAVKTDDNGNIIPYVKRQISAEDAVKTDDNGNIIPYVKRQISEEDPVKTDANGNVVPYAKRQEGIISEEVPVKSDGDDIVAY